MDDCDERSHTVVRHSYFVARETGFDGKVTALLPSKEYKVLAGGCIAHGTTAVISSHPLVCDDGVPGWVVEHIPLARSARVEVVVVGVHDPEGLLEVRTECASWQRMSELERAQLRVFEYRDENSTLPPRTVVNLSCGAPQQRANEPAGNEEQRWLLVGGGFHSASPPVACGPAGDHHWAVVAEPTDALAAYSISLRYSPLFVTRMRSSSGSSNPRLKASSATLGPNGLWRVSLAEPFSEMRVRFGSSESQDTSALHALYATDAAAARLRSTTLGSRRTLQSASAHPTRVEHLVKRASWKK